MGDNNKNFKMENKEKTKEKSSKITPENIETAKKIWSNLKTWKKSKEQIRAHFKKYQDNRGIGTVMPKVALVNSFYGTHLTKSLLVAEHIIKLGNNGLDEKLFAGDPEAIEMIRRVKYDHDEMNLLSFASKYGAFTNPNAYPMYDKHVVASLRFFLDWHDKRNYPNFLEGIHGFISDNDLIGYSYEEIDSFLWIYNQGCLLKKGNTDVTSEIKEFYEKNKHKELFNALTTN